MRLKQDFFNRKTVTVAKDLIGKYLIRKIGKRTIAARITETEAYCGSRDLACHASKGYTQRTKVLFGPPGSIYVYMIYGMYFCLNFVTEREGHPSAVLIRSTEMDGANGPGRLCRKLFIDKKLNGLKTDNDQIWIEDRGEIKQKIKKGRRIGVDYAGEWKDKLWRFYL